MSHLKIGIDFVYFLYYNSNNKKQKRIIMYYTQKEVLDIALRHKRSVAKVSRIIDICEKYGVKAIGNVFSKSPEDLEEIIKICKNNKINIDSHRNVLSINPDVLTEIINICKENHLEMISEVFKRTPQQLKDSIDYVKRFGKEHVVTSIIIKDAEKLKASLPLVRFLGLLPYTHMDASIFDLTGDEIAERTGVLEYLGKPLHKPNRYIHVDRVDRLYTLSNESFENYCIENCISQHVRDYRKNEIFNKIKAAIARNNKQKNSTM